MDLSRNFSWCSVVVTFGFSPGISAIVLKIPPEVLPDITQGMTARMPPGIDF